MIYNEMQEVSDNIDKVKRMQDDVLDMYNPNNKKMKKLMIELVQVEKELNDLEEEMQVLLKSLKD